MLLASSHGGIVHNSLNNASEACYGAYPRMRRRLANRCMRELDSHLRREAPLALDGNARGGMTDTRWIPACADSTPHLELKGSGGNDDRPTGLFDQNDCDVVDVGTGRRDTNEVAQLVEEVVGVVVLKEG